MASAEKENAGKGVEVFTKKEKNALEKRIAVFEKQNASLEKKVAALEKDHDGKVLIDELQLRALRHSDDVLLEIKKGRRGVDINKENVFVILNSIREFAGNKVVDKRYPGGEKHLGRIVSFVDAIAAEYRKFYGRYVKS